MKGRGKAAQTAHRERAWLAWTTAALPHIEGGFPSLQSLIGPADPPKPKTAAQLQAIAEQWNSVLNRK